MERIIENLVEEFEDGRINRRQLIQSLVVTASAAAAGSVTSVAVAADTAPFKTLGINHFSYTVPDYARTRDFYSGLLGMQVTADDGKTRCNLRVGDTFLVVRNRLTDAEPMGVDHICYAIGDWKKDLAFAELKRRGLKPQPEGEDGLQVRDPDGYHVQLVAKQEAPGVRQFGRQTQE
jgi:catechol 2,3-dioxygenase-like lactoylglutathione lyase family enzyme